MDIADNKMYIGANKMAIEANDADIAGNKMYIGANKMAIEANDALIVTSAPINWPLRQTIL
jgi:hypothetical protein